MKVKLVINSLKAVGFTCVFSLILLLLLNFVSYSNSDPDRMLSIFAYITLFVSMFVCGLLASRLNNENSIPSGLLAGGCYVVVLFVTALVVKGDSEMNTFSVVIIYMCSVAVAAFGGVIGKAPLKRSKSTKKLRKNIINKYSAKH